MHDKLTRLAVWPIMLVCALLALIAGACVAGCSTLSNACTQALPVLSQGQSWIDDAQLSITQAEAEIQSQPEDKRGEATALLDKARAALRAASAQLAAASTSCSKPEFPVVFAAFVEAWKELRTFLMLFGGAEGEPAVGDPVVYKELVG